MCGLVSILSKRNGGFQYKEVEAWQEMLIFDQVRGEDSTGALTVLGNSQVKSIKIGSHAQDLFRTNGWNPFISSARQTGRVLIGHNRKATKGSISSENAHPFNEGHIHLVHNGTLNNHSELIEREVDSNSIAAAFAKEEAEKVIEKLGGAFALIWYDRKKKKVFAVRNKERPLWLFENDGVFGLCSEVWMMTGALGRNGFKVVPTDKEKVTYRMLEPGELVTFDPVSKVLSTREISLKKEVQYGYQGAQQATHWSANRNCCDDNFGDDYDSDGVFRSPDVVEILDERGNPIVMGNKPHTEFSVGGLKRKDLILLEVTDVSKAGSGTQTRIRGKLRMPGAPAHLDVTGFLHHTWKLEEAKAEFQNSYCSAEITTITNPVGGPIIWAKDFLIEERKEVSWNNVKLSRTEWDVLVDNEVCNKCGSELDADFLSVSSVERNGTDYKCVCPDCIEKELTTEESKNAFKQASNLALEACVTGGEAAIREIDGATSKAISDSKSLH